MRGSTLPAAFAVLLAAGLWHLPATAQHAAAAAHTPAGSAAPAAAAATGPTLITFAEYRDFRRHYIADRRADLVRRLSAPGLSSDEKARLERIKAYYDRQAAMPPAELDRMFRQRFDAIDTDHDGTLDEAERAAWRQKRQQYYADVASERAAARSDQP